MGATDGKKRDRRRHRDRIDRMEARQATIAKHGPTPEWDGERANNPKDYPWRIVLAVSPGGLANTERAHLECGHTVPRREGSHHRGMKTGCHFCGGGTAQRETAKLKAARRAAEQMTQEQRRRTAKAIANLDEAFRAYADAHVLAKLAIWDAFAADQRITVDGDVRVKVADAAVLCQVTKPTILRWVRDGALSKPKRIEGQDYHRLSELVKVMRNRSAAYGNLGEADDDRVRYAREKLRQVHEEVPESARAVLDHVDDEDKEELVGDSSLL